MKTLSVLVAGATGATGRLLVEELLRRGVSVKAIVRSPEKFSESVRNHRNVSVIRAGILELTDEELKKHVHGCDAVISCLRHELSFKGIYGKPRRLVTDAVRRLCDAVTAHRPEVPVKFILMNTAGNSNRDLEEPVSLAQRWVIGLLRIALPPHPDNEQAADYLRSSVGHRSTAIEWVVVRPDTLLNDSSVSPYTLHPSPTRSALFDPGATSRINVAHFMAELVTNHELWHQWKGKMPVIYNSLS